MASKFLLWTIIASGAACGRIHYDNQANEDAASNEPVADAESRTVDAAEPDAERPQFIVSFSENGVGDFSGVVTDTTLVRIFPTQNAGDVASFGTEQVGGVSEQVALLRFDLSNIPVNAIVDSVELEIYTNFTPIDGGDVSLHRLRESWTENEATWDERSVGVVWTGGGASGGSRDAALATITVIASFTADQHLIDLPKDMVQEWVATPSSNFGLSFESESDGDAGFLSSESVLIENSPLLQVSYH